MRRQIALAYVWERTYKIIVVYHLLFFLTLKYLPAGSVCIGSNSQPQMFCVEWRGLILLEGSCNNFWSGGHDLCQVWQAIWWVRATSIACRWGVERNWTLLSHPSTALSPLWQTQGMVTDKIPFWSHFYSWRRHLGNHAREATLQWQSMSLLLCSSQNGMWL